jgi:hypothetical protein
VVFADGIRSGSTVKTSKGDALMRQFIRIALVSSTLFAATLVSGCVVVPGHRCGYYHCW